jgi:hypothetical protein
MCFIWRCDRDDFDTSRQVHVYLQAIFSQECIPFILDEYGDFRVIYHIWFNLRSSDPMVVVDAFNNQHSVSHVLISKKDDEEEFAIVDEITLLDYRHYARNDCPLVVREVYGLEVEYVRRAVTRWVRSGGEILEFERREAFYPHIPRLDLPYRPCNAPRMVRILCSLLLYAFFMSRFRYIYHDTNIVASLRGDNGHVKNQHSDEWPAS